MHNSYKRLVGTVHIIIQPSQTPCLNHGVGRLPMYTRKHKTLVCNQPLAELSHLPHIKNSHSLPQRVPSQSDDNRSANVGRLIIA